MRILFRCNHCLVAFSEDSDTLTTGVSTVMAPDSPEDASFNYCLFPVLPLLELYGERYRSILVIRAHNENSTIKWLNTQLRKH